MFIICKKQAVYNCIFVFGLILSCVSVFTVITGNNVYKSVSGTPLSGKVIIVDAGHGGPDSGAVGHSGSKEKDINLIVAKKTGEILNRYGAKVIYTRGSEDSIADNPDDTIRNIKQSDMSNRIHIRDNSDADIFISIHMNIFNDKKYNGAQVFYTGSEENKRLAQCIQKSLKDTVDNSNNRNIINSGKSIFVLNGSLIPSVLIECGFISNPDEEKNLLTPSYQDKIADAISLGVIQYLINT